MTEQKEDTILSSQNNVKVIDDEYQEVTNEFDQIRKFLGMYISKSGTEGALHLVKEIFNNACDECVNPVSFADKIDVTFDEEEGSISITDNGRGIPFEKLKDACIKKHVTTKVNREPWMKGLAGRNGVGMTATVALSSYFSITSYRGFEKKCLEFFNGELKEHPIEKIKKEEHGLSVKFIPSEKYLCHEINITTDMVEDYFRHMSYILPENVTVRLYEHTKDGMNPMRKYTFQDISENVKYISSTLEFSPVEVRSSNENFDLWIAFSYDKMLDDMTIESYCNSIVTTEGGTHEIAAQRAICDYFVREAKIIDPNNKFEISYEDCKKGLVLVVNCRHMDPAFEGQHKSKVSNDDIVKVGKNELQNALGQYFNTNSGLLRKILGYLRQMSRIRLESHKIKGLPGKKNTTFLDDAEYGVKFKNVSYPNSHGYKELFITEGDSAYGAINNVRDARYQATFALTGVTNNVHGISLVQLQNKEVFCKLIKVLGCGIGKDFDITKLRWNKIIIATDADIDGSNITSLLCDFFLCFMKPLITEGKVYKLVPPLYLLDKNSIKKFYSGPEWIFDKKDLYTLFHTIISNNTDIQVEDSDKSLISLNKISKMKWLDMNSEYLIELQNLSKRTACNTTVLETVCWYKLLIPNNEYDFKKAIEKEFDEVTYDISDKSLYGSYKGEFVSLIADKLFMKISQRFIAILSQNPGLYICCKNKNDPDDKYDRMTIGDFLTLMNAKYDIKIEQRYKGLGESDGNVLFETSLNPKVRKLIRFSIDNIKETMQTFELLHGKNEKMREKRRELLEEANISYTDIDN